MARSKKRDTAKDAPSPPPRGERSRHPTIVVVVGLALLVFAVFCRVVTHDFVNFDDGLYVTENPHVQQGLTWDSIRWALTSFDANNWHPLTWFSHILDVEAAGLQPGLHHLTSVGLHALAAVLLMLALHRLTKSFWPSVLVAVLFAVHPLRAESVAWISERKDVLSGVFWMLTLFLWARYAERPSIARYLAAAGSFALGLAAKPMVVTLPAVLLLLDIWPLKRLSPRSRGDSKSFSARQQFLRLVAEKLPLLLLAAGSGVLTIAAQRSVVGTFDAFPFSARLANAALSYAGYIRTTVLPGCLSAFYPHPGEDFAFGTVAVAALLLIAITAVAVTQTGRRPWLFVGWFWFLGTLVPVIGLIQVGTQSMADRYTYIPQIGLWIMLAWSLKEVLVRRPEWRNVIVVGTTVVVVAFAALANRQSATWKNGTTLWSQAIKCNDDNWLAHANLTELLVQQGRFKEAVLHGGRSLEINPANPVPHVNVGNALIRLEQPEQAVTHFQAALEIDPGRTVALFNLGRAHAALMNHNEAAAAFRQTLEREPSLVDARVHLGIELLYLHQPAEAKAVLCVDSSVDNTALIFNCGLAHASLGDLEAAVERFRRAVAIDPSHGPSWTGLGNCLADLGRTSEAITALNRARTLRPDDHQVQHRLASLTSQGDPPSTE